MRRRQDLDEQKGKRDEQSEEARVGARGRGRESVINSGSKEGGKGWGGGGVTLWEGAAVVNVWMSERERRRAGRGFTSLQRVVSEMNSVKLILL